MCEERMRCLGLYFSVPQLSKKRMRQTMDVRMSGCHDELEGETKKLVLT